MKRLTPFIIAVMLTLICMGVNGQRGALATEQIKSLSGEWQFRVDSVKELSRIKLPGSCEEQGFGANSTVKDPHRPELPLDFLEKILTY